jgi:hypothetical protein
VALWLDYDNADHKRHRYFSQRDDESDENDKDSEKHEPSALEEWNPDRLTGGSKRVDSEGQAVADHRDGGKGEGSESSNTMPSAVIAWDDSFNGVGMSFSPLNGSKLGKHGPNVLDYDYLTRIKE